MQRKLLFPVFLVAAVLAMLMLIQAAGNFIVRIGNNLVIIYLTATPTPTPAPTPVPTRNLHPIN